MKVNHSNAIGTDDMTARLIARRLCGEFDMSPRREIALVALLRRAVTGGVPYERAERLLRDVFTNIAPPPERYPDE